jgi:hypothetical protein
MNRERKTLPLDKGVLLASVLGCLLAGITLAVENVSSISESPIIGTVQHAFMTLIFPGLIGAAAISGNVHAFHLWIAAGINGLIYFGLGWLFYRVVATLRRRMRTHTNLR